MTDSDNQPPQEPISPKAQAQEPIVAQVENPWVEGIKTIALAAVLAIGIRQFVAEARFIPSDSMVPTLIKDDRLIIDKLSYRFGQPQRGDIVVFNPTATLEEQKFKDAFIKRVVGLPGERIEVKDGKVLINDQPIAENYTAELPNYNWKYDGVIPENSYIVFGDNRNNSYDSHYWGLVPKEKLVGRAIVRFWPPNRAGGIPPKPPYRP
jgi:signal peptidase I